MSTGWILQSKLTAPSPPPELIYRELWPSEQALPPVTLVEAGPGWGKTYALLTLFRRPNLEGAIALWYSLDAYDAEPSTFFTYLLAGLRQHIPDFGLELEALLRGAKHESRHLWLSFFGALATYNLPGFRLVLDDCHHLGVGDAGLLDALAYHFDKLPTGTQLMLASRERLNLPTGRLVARGLVIRLDQERLRFTSAEAKTFLDCRGQGAWPAGWSDLVAELEGWPLGLDLITLVTEKHTGRLPVLTDGRSQLDTYLAEEVFRTLPAARRTFMRQAAILSEITVDACRSVFDAPTAPDHMAALECTHMIQRLAGERGYRFPAYIQNFLRAEAEEASDAADRKTWHERAAAHFQAHDAPEAALPHLVAARDWVGAREACASCFPTMRYDGRQAHIRRWLGAFPAAGPAQDAFIALWQGHGHAWAGQSADAFAAYGRARQRYTEVADEAGAFKALVAQCNTALTLEDEAAFDPLIAEARALHPAGMANDEDRVDLCLIEAFLGEQRGDLAAMAAYNLAALKIPVGGKVEVAASHCIAQINLGTHAIHQGDLAAARRALAQAIALADTWRFMAFRLSAKFLETHLDLLEGHVSLAGAFIASLPTIWPELLDYHDRAVGWTVVGFYHQRREAWRDAEDALQRAIASFEQAGFREGCKVPRERFVWLALQRGQYARAVALGEEERGTESGIYDLAIAIPRARARHLAGQPLAALTELREAWPDLVRLSARLHQARARLYEAASLIQLGERDEATRMLADGLALVEAGGFHFLRGQDQRLWEELAPLMTAEGVPSNGAAALGPGAVSASSPAAGVLSLHCYGGFAIHRDGLLLDRWPRRRAKLLLAALVLNPRGLRSLDLAAAIGCEDGDALNVLRVNAWALRQTLEPGLPKGAPSSYVTLHEDRYVLNFDRVVFSDLFDFDNELNQGRLALERDPGATVTHYERAIAHYRGDLLDDAVCREYFEVERCQHRDRAVGALRWLAAHYEKNGATDLAEAALRRAVELAPCDEGVHLSLMEHYQSRGMADRVRQAYWDCRKNLNTLMNIAPGEAIEKAYRAARQPIS